MHIVHKLEKPFIRKDLIAKKYYYINRFFSTTIYVKILEKINGIDFYPLEFRKE